MCGINGFTFKNEKRIEEMNGLLVHRGPDSRGRYINEQVSLGFQRLKIIDLSDNASQPMVDSENKLAVVFNGELYNFEEIKKDLKEFQFKSKSDTEVILYAYKKWGTDCVKKFNGMWAFAILDLEKNIIFLSRDRLGKKPLFYTLKGNDLIFSSEIKPLFVHDIKRNLNINAISLYLSYRYVLGEETMFENVFKLLPAHNLIFNLATKKIEKIWEYWDLENNELSVNEYDAKKIVEKILVDSVRLRQISDVSIGSINSGGLDSSLITAIMAKINSQPIKTFTVKFPEEGYDETYFAKLIADHCKTEHHEIIVDVKNFLNLMKEYSQKKDEPIGVPNEIALYLLFREIKKQATVILSGEGADEIFAGYSRIFRSPFDYQRLKEIQRGTKNFKDYPSLYEKYQGQTFNTELEHFLFLYTYFPDEERDLILKSKSQDRQKYFEKYFNNNLSYEKKISYAFIKLHLPGLFNRLDNSSMANSVEARCPLVDYRLVEYVFNLPFELKDPWKSEEEKKIAEKKNADEIAEIHDIPKYLLKKIAEFYIPQEIIKRKKQGFPLPLNKWFREHLNEEAKNVLLSNTAKIKEFVHQDNLKKWIEEGEKTGDATFGQKLWMLLSLELWMQNWF